MTLTASGVPYGASFEARSDNNGVFCWTPHFGQAGDFIIEFTADNGHGNIEKALTRVEILPISQYQNLYDNGLLVNAPGRGAYENDASRLQFHSLGMTILGFGNQLAFRTSLLDDFTVPELGWSIERMILFAYQTDAPWSMWHASTINDLRLLIWDGPPYDARSKIVWGDPSKNVLSWSRWSLIFRDSDTMAGSLRRPIMMNVVYFHDTYLEPGTYWLEWSTGGTLASGPWAPPISIDDVTTTGNAWQRFQDGSLRPVVDTGTRTRQGFPFVIRGIGHAVPQEPALTLQLNQSPYTTGDTMIVAADLAPGSLQLPVDAYVVVQAPDGSFYSLRPDGTLFPGIVPIATEFFPIAFNGEILRHTFTGAEPAGSYTWLSALALSGKWTFFGEIDEHRIIFRTPYKSLHR